PVLSRAEPRAETPIIAPPLIAMDELAPEEAVHDDLSVPLSSLQFSVVVAAETERRFERERATLEPGATESDLAALHARIEKEVELYCEEHVHTLGDAERLLATPEVVPR